MADVKGLNDKDVAKFCTHYGITEDVSWVCHEVIPKYFVGSPIEVDIIWDSVDEWPITEHQLYLYQTLLIRIISSCPNNECREKIHSIYREIEKRNNMLYLHITIIRSRVSNL